MSNLITKKSLLLILAGLLLLAFRVLMGMSKFWADDELQIFLIGLASYTSDIFPFFGPDVVYTESQIPGGMQGLLIAEPLRWWSIPESPILFLNVLSFAALLFFGWYLSKRLPSLPKWLIYVWLLTSPWTLNYSTHIENPSYVLFGAILFFTAIFELSGLYENRLLPVWLSFFFIGFSLFFIMQLHLSWVLMLPYGAWVIWVHRRDWRFLLKGAFYFSIGAALPVLSLIPGLQMIAELGAAGVESNVVMNWNNILEVPTIIARFCMLASYEVTRYIGYDSPSRLVFLQTYYWIVPVVAFLFLAGIAQVAFLIWSMFKKQHVAEWNRVRIFTLVTLVLLSASFLFSVTAPKSHTFYILYPVAIWYAFNAYRRLADRVWFKRLALAVIGGGIAFHATLFAERFSYRSLFHQRERVEEAIAQKDYTLLALRRESKLMQSHKDIIWKENKGLIRTDFDVQVPYFKPQNILQAAARSGNFGCKVDSLQPYSSRFSQKLGRLNNPSKAHCSIWVKGEALDDFQLVYEFHQAGEKQWHSLKLPIRSAKEWTELNLEFLLPKDVSGQTELVAYFWKAQPSSAKLYLDDWEWYFD